MMWMMAIGCGVALVIVVMAYYLKKWFNEFLEEI